MVGPTATPPPTHGPSHHSHTPTHIPRATHSPSLEQGSFAEYTIESASLPGDEWEECVDAEGRTFFYNDRTGESTWDDPRNNPALMLTAGESNEDDGGGALALSSPGEWEEVVDADGAVYYYNSETGETNWDRPDGLEGGGDGGGMALGASWAGEEVVTDDGQKWEQADDGEGNFYWCVHAPTLTLSSTPPGPTPHPWAYTTPPCHHTANPPHRATTLGCGRTHYTTVTHAPRTEPPGTIRRRACRHGTSPRRSTNVGK